MFIFKFYFQLLLDLARIRNANPLPPVKSQCGLRLPPDRYCLSASNYKLKKATNRVSLFYLHFAKFFLQKLVSVYWATFIDY